VTVPPPEPVTLNVLAEGLLAQLTSALKLPMTCVASATWPLVIWLGIAHCASAGSARDTPNIPTAAAIVNTVFQPMVTVPKIPN